MRQELFDHRPRVKRKLNTLPANPEQKDKEAVVGKGRFPSWLHRKLPKGGNLWATDRAVKDKRLHTVCEEAQCPNLTECWSHKTATFLVMGKECTRNCGFCDIDFSKTPPPLEEDEPIRVAESVKELGLKHVVLTMVARDDLEDGGAEHLAQVIREIRAQNKVTIEVLTSDLSGTSEIPNYTAIDRVLAAEPEIFNHNIETVRRMTPRVRHRATYDRTLSVLKYVKETHKSQFIKSGLMVGLGETLEEVQETIRDLKDVGCDIITMGQYLQPNPRKLRVKDFVHPDQFETYAEFGRSLGIKHMYCGPFVRSSYNASLVFEEASGEKRLIDSV